MLIRVGEFEKNPILQATWRLLQNSRILEYFKSKPIFLINLNSYEMENRNVNVYSIQNSCNDTYVSFGSSIYNVKMS